MEALVGATVALLSIYDMCKAVDKEMQIYDVRLIEKTKSTVAVSLREPHRPRVRASQRRARPRGDGFNRMTHESNVSRVRYKNVQITVGIITISDRASAGDYKDLGGPALKDEAHKAGWQRSRGSDCAG